MTPFAVSPLSDEPRIRGYLLTDAAYAAYALADLEPPYAAHATWTIATRDAAIEGLALLYDALEPPALFLMGSLPAAEALLRQPIGPERVLFMCQPHLVPAVRAAYRVGATSEMFRMRLVPAGFSPAHLDRSPTPRRLTASDVPAMRALLIEAAAHDERALDDIAFTPQMVESGIYCGIDSGDALVAMAGTHVIAPRAGLAALGNVVVHPQHRRRGLATAASDAVTRALLAMGLHAVYLNVRRDNAAAIRVYERLGFRTVAAFVEGIADRAASQVC